MLDFPKLKFFLGANTPAGFFSLFSELYDPETDCKIYLLKGGPGTGKSRLMSDVAEKIEKEGYLCERIYCAADPASLDAVIFPELAAAVADCTPPHVIEPKYPGAVERIINLGDYWDAGALRKKAADIRSLTRANAEEHRRATQFLSAVRAIDNDSLRTAALCLDTGKVENFAKRLAGRELRAGEGNPCPGKEKKRFFSAVTPEGISFFYESVRFLCGRVIAVKDEYSPASSLLFKYVKEQALGMGYDVVSCYCPLRPEEKLEHLFVPELELGFITENSYHSMPEKAAKVIRAKRFYDNGRMAESKLRLSFNKRAKNDLIQEAVNRLEAAKAIHDGLEACYAAAMDFERVHNLAQKIVDEILV